MVVLVEKHARLAKRDVAIFLAQSSALVISLANMMLLSSLCSTRIEPKKVKQSLKIEFWRIYIFSVIGPKDLLSEVGFEPTPS